MLKCNLMQCSCTPAKCLAVTPFEDKYVKRLDIDHLRASHTRPESPQTQTAERAGLCQKSARFALIDQTCRAQYVRHSNGLAPSTQSFIQPSIRTSFRSFACTVM